MSEKLVQDPPPPWNQKILWRFVSLLVCVLANLSNKTVYKIAISGPFFQSPKKFWHKPGKNLFTGV